MADPGFPRQGCQSQKMGRGLGAGGCCIISQLHVPAIWDQETCLWQFTVSKLKDLFLVDVVTLLYNCGFRIIVLTNKNLQTANSNMMKEKLYWLKTINRSMLSLKKIRIHMVWIVFILFSKSPEEGKNIVKIDKKANISIKYLFQNYSIHLQSLFRYVLVYLSKLHTAPMGHTSLVLALCSVFFWICCSLIHSWFLILSVKGNSLFLQIPY